MDKIERLLLVVGGVVAGVLLLPLLLFGALGFLLGGAGELDYGVACRSSTCVDEAWRMFITSSLMVVGTIALIGRVLVVGGMGPGRILGSAEVWDAQTASFDAAGPLQKARVEHTTTPLHDGRVLVVGGVGRRYDDLASAEVWNPTTNMFVPAGSLTRGRSYHTATPLLDGRVLVVGGEDRDGAIASAEVWSPNTSANSE